jgi:DNA-binding GntR family transcriptional regulator
VRGRNGGTFVLRKSRGRKRSILGPLDRVAPHARLDRITVLAFDTRACDADIADKLGVNDSEKIRYIERIMATPDGPVMHVQDFMPAPLGRRLERGDLDRSLLKPMIKRLGARIDRVQEDTEAWLADGRIAGLLAVRTGTPLLRVTRCFLARNGRCVFLSVLLISSRYRISVVLPEGGMG